MNEIKNKNNTESIREYKADLSEEISEESLLRLKQIPSGKNGLLEIKGPNVGDVFYIEKDNFQIGRSPESDVLLDDITVSRKHAILQIDDNGHKLIDSGSLNGSYLNGNIVDEALLANGDRIQIGKYIFIYFSIK